MRYEGATRLGRRRMCGGGALSVSLRDNQCLGCHGSSRNDPPYGTLGGLATHRDGEGRSMARQTNRRAAAWPLRVGLRQVGGGGACVVCG